MIAETHRSSPAFALGGVVPAFACIGCGADLTGYHFLQVRGVCPGCCIEHDFQYDRDERQHACIYCGEPAPSDWYDD